MYATGDLVQYHGTQTAHHGVYLVVAVPDSAWKRGYVLSSPTGQRLYNVSPSSISHARQEILEAS